MTNRVAAYAAVRRSADWYVFDFARSRPSNLDRTPVGVSAAWYHALCHAA
jgi:hypothetical protein